MTMLRCTRDLKNVFRLTIFYVLSIRARMTIILVVFNNCDLVDFGGCVWTAFDLEF